MSLIYKSPSSSHSVYLGGKADAKSKSQLESWGVTHILNVTPEKEAGVQSGVANYFESKPIKGKHGGTVRITYRRVPVYDAATSDLLSCADSIVSYISSGLHHGSVLVHCKAGVSRSATCVMFFLMRKVGMAYDKAFALCRKHRADVCPIPAFESQLRQYEAKCRKIGAIKDDGKKDANSNKEKKRKAAAAIGPSIGPAIGPSVGPVAPSRIQSKDSEGEKAVTGETEEKSSKRARSAPIGPAIGPSKEGMPEKIGGKREEARPAVIGPSMGPTTN